LIERESKMIPADFALNDLDDIGLHDQLPSVEEYKSRQHLNISRLSTSTESASGDQPNLHDQLPSVEEYKANVTTNGGKESQRRSRTKLFLLVLTPVVLASILLAIGVSLLRDDDTPDRQNSLAATSSPIAEIPEEDLRVYKFVDYIVKQGWSDPDDLDTPQNPQWDAAVWLSNFDGDSTAEPEDVVDLRQRYALATFYFATSGREWTRALYWLENTPVCEWAQSLSGEGDETITVGVGCKCRQGGPCDPDTVKQLFLPGIGLKGSIPREIGLLTDLEKIDLYSNDLNAAIPDDMQYLEKLGSLVLYDNLLSGEIPEWIGSLSDLATINLAKNKFEGGVPSSLFNLTKLITLNLENNDFRFQLDDLQLQSNLQALFLGGNNIYGKLTEERVDIWEDIEVLDLSNNQLTGPLPSNLFNQEALIVLDLHGNKFTGHIPEFEDSPLLTFLALQDNDLTGSIPASIGFDHLLLRHIDLSQNMLNSTIPDTIGSLNALEYLFIALNPFLEPGPVPSFLGELTNLVDVSFQDSNREGQLPTELGLLTNLVLLDLAANEIEGDIPVELGNADKLRFLFLNENHLSGNVPGSFEQLTDLVVTMIDSNDLTGNVNSLCTTEHSRLVTYVADCSEFVAEDGIECECCECCNDDDPNCNDVEWFGDLNPVWEDEYVRKHYAFEENQVIYAKLSYLDETGEDEDQAVGDLDADFGNGND
jgi:Leucine-rich repeat (LRR) protein